MGSIATAPCDWPVIVPDGCAALGDLPEEPDPETGLATHDDVIEAATAFLWSWTNRAFGLCEVKVRPCREDCPEITTYEGAAGVPSPLGAPWVPALIGGEWRNVVCGGCRRQRCSCNRVEAIALPGPVDSIVEVRIDGELVEASAYRVDNRSRLIRDDGEPWPTCQDLGSPDGAAGTWSVTYRWGAPVPKGGQIAAGVLACEFAKWLQNRECALPQRVQTVTREGVTVGILDAFEGLEAGRTGLWLVDSWIESVNRPPARASVHSPDRRRMQVTTYRGGP